MKMIRIINNNNSQHCVSIIQMRSVQFEGSFNRYRQSPHLRHAQHQCDRAHVQSERKNLDHSLTRKS